MRPHKSETPISANESKFGGVPNFSGFDEYPCCDRCKAPLNFVLQLHKKHFPDFYFPNNATLFQLFRCPNLSCPDDWSEFSDQPMFHYYFIASTDEKILDKPVHKLEEVEDEIPDCFLKPVVVDDYTDDVPAEEFIEITKKFGEEASDYFSDKYSPAQRSKFGGYPSFTQSPYYPVCSCGKEKEFFFQLSSEDPEDGVVLPPSPDKWNAHGIMIGDVGNIDYYVCKSCGVKTIESSWDCC